jgi:ADP-ribosyl-[dinitrogen reductase] hydrolase
VRLRPAEETETLSYRTVVELNAESRLAPQRRVVLHVLREAKDLATALKRAVALGGDTDTTAAIVGGILGCQLEDAERQIPWISRVGMPDARLIEAAAAGLYELRRSSQ